jgi:hypothetical protein
MDEKDRAEIERRMGDEVNSMINLYLMWRLRDVAGEFPTKVRVTLFFMPDGNRGHTVEFEHRYGPEALQHAEGVWEKFERDQLVKASQDFLKNPNVFGDDAAGDENVE